MIVEWRCLPEHENHFVSNYGQIFSINKYRGHKPKFLKTRLNKAGYYRVQICKKGFEKTMLVHRLVIYAFVGVSEKPVNHVNGIKADNRLENLEYCTFSENTKHAYKNKLMNPPSGSNHHNSKLNEVQIYNIKYIDKEKNYILAEKYNVSRPTISGIKSGKHWKHITKDYFESI